MGGKKNWRGRMAVEAWDFRASHARLLAGKLPFSRGALAYVAHALGPHGALYFGAYS